MKAYKRLLEAASVVAFHPDYEKIPSTMIAAMADLRLAVQDADEQERSFPTDDEDEDEETDE